MNAENVINAAEIQNGFMLFIMAIRNWTPNKKLSLKSSPANV